MGGKFKRQQRAARARDSANEKKTMVPAATGPAGVMYKQGAAKGTANFDRINEVMAEYVGVLLGSVALRAVRTLAKPVNKIRTKPEKNYHLVAAAAAEELLVVTEVLNKYNPNNSKNNPVVDAGDWRLTMNMYMKKYNKYMRDERQWKIDGRKSTT